MAGWAAGSRLMEAIDISLVRIEDADHLVVGLLYTPAGEASQAVVLGHGYGGSKQDMSSLGQALCGAGYHVFIPDIRGHRLGGTGGYLNSLDDVSEDLETSVGFTKNKTRAERLVLCGHSMSGAAGAKTAALHEDVDALILLGNGLRPIGQDLPPEAIKLIQVRSKYVDGIEGIEIRHQVQFMMREYMGRVSPKPVLIVAGSSDNINNEQRCRDLLDMTDGPKSLMLVDSDHFRLPLCSSEPVLQWLKGLHP
jgi:esterase/lipase